MPTLAVLNNITTGNAYTAANTAQVPTQTDMATDISITVTGAAVMMQVEELAISGGLITSRGWGLEEFVPPKMLEISEAHVRSVRFRSAVAGTPAQVTCSLNA